MSIIDRIIDPFNLRASFEDSPHTKAMKRYRDVYYKAQKLGLPLDALGFQKPPASVRTAVVGPGLPKIPINGPEPFGPILPY